MYQFATDLVVFPKNYKKRNCGDHQVMRHPDLLGGNLNTSFIGSNPELLVPQQNRDRAQRMMQYLGDLAVNGHDDPGVSLVGFRLPEPPAVPVIAHQEGSDQSGLKDLKHVLNESGPEGFAKAVRAHKGLLLTDTTWCELLSFCACVCA
jgi:pyruvate carboxylase